LDIEKDVDLDLKINLESRNLFNTLSLPHDHITTLNYSNNFISKIEKLQTLRLLQYLDFSDNHLVEIAELPELLKVLLLGRNRITRITGLEALGNLEVLDLSGNFIEEIEGLEKLQNLKVLNLESNKIRTVPDIGYLTSLVELNLKKNQIQDVAAISLNYLKRLVLGYNLLDDLQVVSNFFNCSQLLELSLEGNTFCRDSAYRTFVIVRLKMLKFLDGKRITEEERRTCFKLDRKASEKRIEAEKILQRDNEKRLTLEDIEKSWDLSKKEMYIYPSPQPKKNYSKSYGAFKRPIAKSQVYDGGFYQITNGYLEM
jgi:leucine-rich repeat-containing protein 49